MPAAVRRVIVANGRNDGSSGLPSPRVIRTGSDVVLGDFEGAYHRVGMECPPYVTSLPRVDLVSAAVQRSIRCRKPLARCVLRATASASTEPFGVTSVNCALARVMPV